jgi:SNF2 family DNA or RNA helicase
LTSSISTKPKLLSYFDSWTLAKGKNYFNKGHILKYSRGRDHQIEGAIKGSDSKKYETTLFLNETEDLIFDTACSCPLICDCKHTAALALAFLEAQKKTSQPEPVAPSRRVHTTSRAKSDDGTKILNQVTRKVGLDPYSEADIKATGPARTPRALSIVKEESALPKEKTLKLPTLKGNQLNALYAIESAVRINEMENESRNGAVRQTSRTLLLYLLDDASGFPEVNVVKTTSLKDGSFGKFTEIDLYRLLQSASPPQYVQTDDIDVLSLLGKVMGGYSYFSRNKITTSDNGLFNLILTRLLDTGRCYFKTTGGKPLKLGPTISSKPAWMGSDGKYKLCLNSTDAEANSGAIRSLSWQFPYYLDQTDGTVGPTETGMPPLVSKALSELPTFSRDELLAFLVAAADHDVSQYIPEPPAECRIEIRQIQPQGSLELQSFKVRSNVMVGNQYFAKGQRLSALVATASYPGVDGRLYEDETGKLILERHDKSGGSPIKALTDRGFHSAPRYPLGLENSDKVPFVASDAATLVEMALTDFSELKAAGWHVDPDCARELLPTELDDSHLNFEVDSKDDWWFSLSLKIEINGKQYPLLPILLTALKKLSAGINQHNSIDMVEPVFLDEEAIESLNCNERFVAQLDNGTFITLPFDRVRVILMALKELLNREPNSLEVSVNQLADLLDYEGLAKARWFGADRARSLLERLRGLMQPQAVSAPKKFSATLRPYQLEGLSWLQTLAKNQFAGILADDMGLGKTVQLLAHIALEKEEGRLKKPFLVISPTSVLPNWLEEAKKFAPHLRVVPFSGADRFDRLAQAKKADIVLTTYPLITRDIELHKIDWHGVALDEAQAIKNHETLVSQTVVKLKASQRFCMTGTPIENHVGELWSQFRFLLPGMLGNLTAFNKFVRRPIEKKGNIELKQTLAKRIKPFVLRRTKAEVAAELPEKTTIVRSVDLQGRQRDLYETVRIACSKQVRDEIERKGFKMSQIMILDALLKLRQACCDPQLVKLDQAKKVKESAKLDVLMEMLTEITDEGRKVIVFSQFTSMLDIIAEQLSQTAIRFVQLRGDTRDRATPVNEFQQGDASVFLISLKAGGTGLNLTAADTVIHYDPWWNPAVEDQATDRAHRIGQDKAVFVYKLIAQGTIEQRMVELQERKRALASGIIDAQAGGSAGFTEEDLALLLEPIA